MMLRYHILAFLAGFILDLIVGDPYWLPHPVRWIGKWISVLERCLLGRKEQVCEKSSEWKRCMGRITVLLVLVMTSLVTFVILGGAYLLHPYAGCMVETVMTYQILATKCLRVESMKVYEQLEHGTLEGARRAVSMIVGRDTEKLNAQQVARATVETIAENISDGVIAPMLYTALGGPVLGFLYKAINTMDSMLGYKNERYLDFGRCGARLDDAANYLPARISAWFMIFASVFLGKAYDTRNAVRIFFRDRYQHASPNSAHTESVCAGALGLRLAGDASYFGKIVSKPYIGDAIREISAEDIRRTNRLLYVTAAISECVCLLLLLLVTMVG